MLFGLLFLHRFSLVLELASRYFSVGLAVGFGAQTVVKDIITGFFVIFEGQFDVDYVQINSSGVTIAEGYKP